MPLLHSFNDKIRQERKELQAAIRERMTGYILGALGLVAGLAWNDAIKAAIEQFFPLNKDGLVAKFIYALVVTLVVVIIISIVSKIFAEKKETEDKK